MISAKAARLCAFLPAPRVSLSPQSTGESGPSKYVNAMPRVFGTTASNRSRGRSTLLGGVDYAPFRSPAPTPRGATAVFARQPSMYRRSVLHRAHKHARSRPLPPAHRIRGRFRPGASQKAANMIRFRRRWAKPDFARRPKRALGRHEASAPQVLSASSPTHGGGCADNMVSLS